MTEMEKSYQYNQKIVVIGGGTGSFTLLRGLTRLNNPELISAIPGMWDNGGSTGILRSELGILPVGDPRQNSIGLMEDEEQQEWAIALSQDRFKNKGGPLKGHDFFNLQLDLLISAAGGTQEGIDAFRKLYRIRGHVYPVTLSNVDLGAQQSRGPDLYGEEKLDERWKDQKFDPENKIEQVFLSHVVNANPLAIRAIEEADKIIFPPGSLYGSILPHFQVRGITEGLVRSRGKIIFVSNLMTERGQTDTMVNASDYLKEFVQEFGHKDRIDYMIVNQNGVGEEPLEFYLEKGHQKPIQLDATRCLKLAPNMKIAFRPMAIYVNRLLRHDYLKLAEVVLNPEKFILALD